MEHRKLANGSGHKLPIGNSPRHGKSIGYGNPRCPVPGAGTISEVARPVNSPWEIPVMRGAQTLDAIEACLSTTPAAG